MDAGRFRDDIISALMRELAELHPEASTAELLKIEVDLRRKWGGKARYICKNEPQVSVPVRDRDRRA